jgi:PmbA protein
VKVAEPLFAVLEELTRQGWEEVEVFHKRGRSRTVRYLHRAEATAFRQEEGWAVRAGDRRRSFLHAATGTPRPDAPWPDADGRGLRLPSARPIPAWTPPPSLDAPLLGESEALALFEVVARELDSELPGARLLGGHLDDGSSESQLLSSREVASVVRHRAAFLRLEAVGPTPGGKSVSFEVVGREARRFHPTTLARRLADRVAIAERGDAPARDRGEFLLAPPVAAGLMAALAGLWVGPEAEERTKALLDRGGRLGSDALTLIDDGRLPGGVFEAPADGEGQPTRAVTLVETGSFRQPLVAWWQSLENPRRGTGCALRPGWRDLPRPGPTHLYLDPDPGVGVAELLNGLSRGYYLLALDGPPRILDDHRRFAAPVAGFAIDGGRATGPVAGAWLVGSVSTFLRGILAAARDLTFLPAGGGLVGSPTIFVRGLELRRSP